MVMVLRIGIKKRRKTMKKYILFLFTVFILSGCATHYIDATYDDPYGFLLGIWHGFCFLFVLVGKILSFILGFVGIDIFEEIKFIGQPNTGFTYGAGYFIGLVIAFNSNLI